MLPGAFSLLVLNRYLSSPDPSCAGQTTTFLAGDRTSQLTAAQEQALVRSCETLAVSFCTNSRPAAGFSDVKPREKGFESGRAGRDCQ